MLAISNQSIVAQESKISLPRHQLDKRIEKEFQQGLRWVDPKLNRDYIHVRVYNGYALLFGTIDNQTLKEKTVEHIERFSGVRRVFNQLQIGAVNPSWFDQQVFNAIIRSNLLTTSEFDGSKIKFESYGSTVYLLGIVTTREAEDAVSLISLIKGVEEIVTLFEYTD